LPQIEPEKHSDLVIMCLSKKTPFVPHQIAALVEKSYLRKIPIPTLYRVIQELRDKKTITKVGKGWILA
jgi:hypothetical protein